MQRPTTTLSYSDRVQRVIRHIHDHLDAPLDLRRLADVACLSPYHFHRIYRAITRETVAETLSRLKLHRAAIALAKTARSLPDIAREAGYGTVPSFSRAFHKTHGMPPSRFRTASRYTGSPAMEDISVQDRTAMHLIATHHRGPAYEIGKAFDRLVAWAGPRGLLIPGNRGVAVYLTDMAATPAADQHALAGLTVESDVPIDDDAIVSYSVPGGRHAVILHKGPYSDIGRSYKALYAWLAASAEEPADKPVFEVNLNNPRNTSPAALLTEICIPLR